MKQPYSRDEFAALYRRHVSMVYQICLMLMRNVPDAEDATQTVFRKVLERGDPFRDPEHEKAWLIVTARNECRDQLKHWWRNKRVDPAALEQLTWEQPEDGALWEHILSLPEKYRLVLYLHYYQGYTSLEKSVHSPYLAGSGQVEAEGDPGGERVWMLMNSSASWRR